VARLADVRIERHRDAALALRLERTAFRRGEREVAHRLQLDDGGHFVARDSRGEAIGAASCVVCPGGDLAWLGGMVVLPEARRQGIGRRLLAAALEYADERGARTIGLDATDVGRPLYESVGFRPFCVTTRWARQHAAEPYEAAHAVYPASGAELMEIAAFDRSRFGANRAPWIAAVLADFPGRAFVAYDRASGRLAGYALGQGEYVGPLVADDPGAARALLHATESAGTPATLDVLDANPHIERVLPASGYAPTAQRCLRMVRGPGLPGRVECQYAVAAWALG